MKREWGLIAKILNEVKTLETRWYRSKIAPWGRVKVGEKVYFKDSGGLVEIVATISSIEEIIVENEIQRAQIIKDAWKADLDDESLIPELEKYAAGKKYCILIGLDNPLKIKIPFHIDKKGFGMQCAWITADSIEKLRVGD